MNGTAPTLNCERLILRVKGVTGQFQNFDDVGGSHISFYRILRFSCNEVVVEWFTQVTDVEIVLGIVPAANDAFNERALLKQFNDVGMVFWVGFSIVTPLHLPEIPVTVENTSYVGSPDYACPSFIGFPKG